MLASSLPEVVPRRRRESLALPRGIGEYTRGSVSLKIIGKIHRDRRNCGVITEIGPLHIIHGFFLSRIAPRAREIRRSADVDIIRRLGVYRAIFELVDYVRAERASRCRSTAPIPLFAHFVSCAPYITGILQLTKGATIKSSRLRRAEHERNRERFANAAPKRFAKLCKR